MEAYDTAGKLRIISVQLILYALFPRKYEYVCSRFSVTKPMRASWLKWKETGILDPVLARRLIRLSEIARKSKYVISIAKVNVLIMGGGKRR